MQIRISKGGQVSLPATIRRRWATDTLIVEDLGDRVVLWPVPPDPIAAAMGAFPAKGHTAEEDRSRIRREEAEAHRRRRLE
jgi:hypothetical protein